MKRTLLLAMLCLSAACATRHSATPGVPTAFLQTNDPAWRSTLAMEVDGDLHATPLNEAVLYLSSQTAANVTFRTHPDAPLPMPPAGQAATTPPEATAAASSLPTITRKFPRMPLRTALYLLARDSGATVTWELSPDGFQRGIDFIAK